MREIIEVKKSDGNYSQIVLGNAAHELEKRLQGERVIVITDTNIYTHYASLIDRYEKIVIGLGETHKTMATLELIYEHLLKTGADRKTYIVGFGGGIVTDVAGFAASTYMRGMRFGFVATTLLAQVDASVGGKNGVNFQGYKNMVGTFNQPDFVVCDIETLGTLPERELRAGMAEIIKCGLIADPQLFHLFEEHSFSDFTKNKELLQRVIRRSVEIKAKVVEADEKENGERRKLNLGHTLAHAIEKSTRNYLHGEAVAIGLCLAADLSVLHGSMSAQDAQRVKKAIQNTGLPTHAGIDHRILFNALKSDKKKESDSIHFIYMKGIGDCEVVSEPFDLLKENLKRLP